MSRTTPHDEPPSPAHFGLEVEHAKQFMFVLLRYRWLVASVLVASVAVALVGTLLQTPLFRANTLLRVDRGRLNLVEDVTEEDRWVGLREFYGTQTRILRSRTLIERTLDNLDVWDHPLLAVDDPGDGDLRRQRVQRFLDMLGVSQIRSTQLVDVAVTSADPVFSRDLANAHAREYIAYLSDAESGVARNTGSFIREQIEKLQREIAAKETLLQDLGAEQDLILEQSDEILAQQLSELHAELTDAQGELAAAEARYVSLTQSAGNASPDVFNNPVIQRLRHELSTLQKEYAELGMRFEPKWPEMQRKERAIREIEHRLEVETQNLAKEILASARSEFLAASNRVEILKRTLEEQREESRDVSSRTSEYAKIRVELESQRAMLQNLTRREGETGLSAELEERQNVSVGIVEEAIAPERPYTPNLLTNLLLGIVLGLVMAPTAAFAVNFWDTAVHNAEDLRRYAAVPCLAAIPHFMREKKLVGHTSKALLPGSRKNRTRELVRASSSGSPGPGYPDKTELLERFKFLRNSLVLSSPGNPPKVVLVTSGSEQEGKSFVASNFASSYAQLNKKVLLIDADLRRPSVHNFFGLKNSVGLTNVIIGQRTLRDGAVQQTNIPNLYVLLAGPQSPSPAELLGSESMTKVLDECMQHFDIVVIDSAPLFPVVDTHALASQADMALLVVRSGSTQGPAVRNALELLERAHGKVAGIVLNDIDLMDFAQSYYYRHYSYSYAPDGYQSRARA